MSLENAEKDGLRPEFKTDRKVRIYAINGEYIEPVVLMPHQRFHLELDDWGWKIVKESDVSTVQKP